MKIHPSPISDKQPFIIIGAMKSGSTSIYTILKQVDDIYLPANKEPRTLTTDRVFKEVEKYYTLIGLHRKEHFIGEASTYYTKYPEYKNVPERALKVLGAQTKIIYIVRDPIKRAISHANHDISMKIIPLNAAKKSLLTESRYANYSNYKLQLNQWVSIFPSDNILVIKLENFISNPKNEIDKILEFLGINTQTKLNYNIKENSSARKLVPIPLIRTIVVSDFYRNSIKQLIPGRLTQAAKRIFSKKMRTADFNLSPQEREVFLKKCDGSGYDNLDFNQYLTQIGQSN